MIRLLSEFRVRCAALVVAACAGPLLGLSAAWGQNALEPNLAPTLRGRFPSDRELAFMLVEAEELLHSERSLEGIEMLQSLLDQPADAFLLGGPQTLRSHLETVFRSFSPEQIDAYQRRYEAEATRLIDEGLRDGDSSRLAEVVRRFYFTRSGYRAARMLGLMLVDEGDLLGGARYLELAADHPQAAVASELRRLAAQCWSVLGEESRATSLLNRYQLARRESPWSNLPGSGSSPALRDWLALRQSPQTQIQNSYPCSPLGEIAWRTPMLDAEELYYPGRAEEVRSILTALDRQIQSEVETGVIPVLHPVGVGNVLVWNSYGLVRAVDAETGELLWVSITDDTAFGKLFTGDAYRQENLLFQPLADLLLGQRAWRDLTKGHVSSDGERVYAIRDGGMVAGNPVHGGIVTNSTHALLPWDHNRLMAFEINEGEMLWVAGGKRMGAGNVLSVEGELVEMGKLEGLFFLGPPLPSDGRLYCLAEDRGEVGLYVLDAATGSPLWSLPLAQPGRGISHHLDRRWAGLTPVLSGQILVCPTGDGSLIGIDVLSRSIVWVVEYKAPADPDFIDPLAWRRMQAQGSASLSLKALLSKERWLDSVPMVHGSVVLFAPFDADELYAVDLLSGKLLWVRPRGHAWFLGALHDHFVVTVGRDGLTAIDLQTGREVWDNPLQLPPPAGRGVQTGHLYRLPLSTGEIVSIDLSRGRILARSPLPDGVAPGNLLAMGDRLILVNAREIVGLNSLSEVNAEIAALFAEDAASIPALRKRGELRLHEGQGDLGLADLERPVLEGDQPARALLAHTIAEGLRFDFPAFRERAAEVAELIDDPQQLREFTRVHVSALEAHGEYQEAFDQLTRLLTDEQLSGEELLPDGRRLRADRWLTSWLSRLYQQADEPTRAELDLRLAELLVDVRSPSNLFDLAAIAPASPLTSLVLERMQTFEDRPDPLVWEQYLMAVGRDRRLSEGDNLQADRLQADRLLLELYRAHRDGDGLGWMLDVMQSAYPPHTPLEADGRTLGDYLAAVREESSEFLRRELTWPGGPLEIEERSGPASSSQVPLPILGELPGPLTGWSFTLESNLSVVYARDATGMVRWTVPSGMSGGNVAGSVRYVEARGSLVLIVLAERFLVVETLTQPDGRILFSESLTVEERRGGRAHANTGTSAFRFRGPQATDTSGTLVGNVGPLTSRMLCFQVGTDLFGTESHTGLRIWTHRNLPLACELIGDEQYLLAKPPRENEFLLFSTLDGKLIGTRPVPRDLAQPDTLVNWGRCWLTQSTTGDELHLAMRDLVEQRDRWTLSLPAESLWTAISGTDIAILEPDGRLRVVQYDTGEVLHETMLPPLRDLQRFSLQPLALGWLFLGEGRPHESTRVQNPGWSGTLVNGDVSLISPDFQSVLWTKPVSLQVLPGWHPQNWPVLLFTCRRSGPRLLGRGLTSADYFAVTILDARTGALLYEGEYGTPQLQPVWDADLEQPRIEIRYGTTRLQVKFELPPGAPSAEPADNPPTPDSPPESEQLEAPPPPPRQSEPDQSSR